MSWWKITAVALAVVATAAGVVIWYLVGYAELDIYVPLYAEHCGGCHGHDLGGSDRGVALTGRPLAGGDTVSELMRSIERHGAPGSRLPGIDGYLDPLEIKGLAIYVAERRLGQRFTEFNFYADLDLPDTPLHSELHDFHIEPLIEGLDPLTFSIAPLPDGSWLVTEKERGLSLVSPDGTQSAPIEGTPRTGASFSVFGVHYGIGWLLDVAPHPDYLHNGWIYLHYTDICPDGCADDFEPSAIGTPSMNRLDRGRIVAGRWVDVETIWQAPRAFYNTAPDTGAGGRIAFDDSGHVFISVGIKEAEEATETASGPQRLDNPFGKIYRINDDGSVPEDNPFAVPDAADVPFYRQTIWTYGHRSPQGLEWNRLRGRMWESEMGPRGGDEINELRPGRNYGWPFHSFGLEYSGREVARYRPQGIEFDPESVEKTLVDITPSPAISSFAFYSGAAFRGWQDNVLIGSLKGRSLFRLVFDGTRLVHRETLIKDLARIRDVEIGYDGCVYLLLENVSGSAIVRLAPADEPATASRS